MDMNSPELAYLIAMERQEELVAAAQPRPSSVLRGLADRVRSALAH
jgi:hypothetical protein